MNPGGRLLLAATAALTAVTWPHPAISADATTPAATTSAVQAAPATAAPNTDGEPTVPTERILLKPGKSLSVNMATEDIICTNDCDLARRQRESYPDSPEASFIYAVALSRTSHVEDALKEVRRARKLAEKQGGPSYFDKMIDTYENMLGYYPDDNQVRYHLAWAYYMKAYVLAKYSHQPAYKEWVAAETANTGISTENKEAGTTGSGTDVLKDMHKASSTISSAAPQAIPQVQKYYQLATAKLDDLLARDPKDTWARVYRAFLKAEAGGDLQTAMSEWQKVRDEQPNNPAAYFFLGEGYLKQGNLKECLSNVSRAIALRAVGN
ncbi:MAG: tetratricopeptide repeat protein [Cyanobacteria bacterium REEB67]|nr:tetratricopeptide repeat protein [Cyanobacteria bacterium REEB67]